MVVIQVSNRALFGWAFFIAMMGAILTAGFAGLITASYMAMAIQGVFMALLGVTIIIETVYEGPFKPDYPSMILIGIAVLLTLIGLVMATGTAIPSMYNTALAVLTGIGTFGVIYELFKK